MKPTSGGMPVSENRKIASAIAGHAAAAPRQAAIGLDVFAAGRIRDDHHDQERARVHQVVGDQVEQHRADAVVAESTTNPISA